MNKILPETFKEAFLKVTILNDKDIIGCWNRSLTEFTSQMRRIFPNIAEELNLELYNGDYYTIDAIFYEAKDIKYFNKNAVYAEYISIALEHENRLYGSQIEINKLQLINTPLKVLIAYSGSSEEINSYLSMYSEIINKADIFSDFSNLRRQLVIFGACENEKLNWSFHVYKHRRFIEI